MDAKSNKVTINGKSYELSPLRCKHLKRISELVAQAIPDDKAGVYGVIEKWMPFILDSIKVNTPDFPESELQEMTLVEFNLAWASLVSISGIEVTTKGESKPMVSNGPSSTVDSALPSAGPTVM